VGSTVGQSNGPSSVSEAVEIVLQVLGDAQLKAYLTALPGRCSECGYHIATQGHRPGPRYFWGFAPWEEPGQDDAAGCSRWAPAKVAGIPPGYCSDCGEPLAGMGLIERCKEKHAICRGCGLSFDGPGGLLLLSPGRRCRRRKHQQSEEKAA
jgi:hypothetical protein